MRFGVFVLVLALALALAQIFYYKSPTRSANFFFKKKVRCDRKDFQKTKKT
jgi:hypothetical protein